MPTILTSKWKPYSALKSIEVADNLLVTTLLYYIYIYNPLKYHVSRVAEFRITSD